MLRRTKSKRFKNVWSATPPALRLSARKLRNLTGVQLVVGEDHEELALNSIGSFLSTNRSTELSIYHAGTSKLFLESVRQKANVRLFDIRTLARVKLPNYGAHVFGSEGFNSITALKWQVILHEIRRSRSTILFFDTDVYFRRPVRELVMRLARKYPIGMQDEGSMRLPPTLCTGFMYWTPQTAAVLRTLWKFSQSNPGLANDQIIFNDLLKCDPRLRKWTYSFPSSLFPNGLHWRLFSAEDSTRTVAELEPYIFHANFVVGSEAKKNLLKHTKNWIEN